MLRRMILAAAMALAVAPAFSQSTPGSVSVPRDGAGRISATGLTATLQALSNAFAIKADVSTLSSVATSGSAADLSGVLSAARLPAWVAPQADPRAYGADPTGVSDSTAAIAAAVAASGSQPLRVHAGTYSLASNVAIPATPNIVLDLAPAATYTGAGRVKMDALFPTSWPAVLAYDFRRLELGAGWADSYFNIFNRASYVKNTGTSAALVAWYGEGESTGAGRPAWAGNFVGVGRSAGAVAWSIEANPVSFDPSATVYGVDVRSSGTAPSTVAYRVGVNNAASGFKYLHYIDATSFNPINYGLGAVLHVAGSNLSAYAGINLASARFSNTELNLPSVRVGATRTTPTTRALIMGGGDGRDAQIGVTAAEGGSATAGDLRLAALGSGGRIRIGPDDAASISSQIVQPQSVADGVTDGSAVGAPLYIRGAAGTGTGSGGYINFQVTPPAATSGSTQNGYVTALQLTSPGTVNIPAAGSHQLGSTAFASWWAFSGGRAFAGFTGNDLGLYGWTGKGVVIGGGCATFGVSCAAALSVSPTNGLTLGPATGLTLAAGEVGLTRIAASAAAPGAAGGKLALVCGTTAGTAKLVVTAGAATAAQTIIDNVGSGVSGC